MCLQDNTLKIAIHESMNTAYIYTYTTILRVDCNKTCSLQLVINTTHSNQF